MMEATREEAFSLLRQWQREGRIVQVGLCDLPNQSGKAWMQTYGCIESLSDQELVIDARSFEMPAGDNLLAHFQLAGSRFYFADWREAAPHQAEHMKLMFDGAVSIVLATGVTCYILALRANQELTDLLR
jgi:hypothetical protein